MKPHVTEPPELVSILDQFSITLIFFIIPCQEMASWETKVEVKTWYSLTDFLLYRDQCLQSTNKQTKNIIIIIIYLIVLSSLFFFFFYLIFTLTFYSSLFIIVIIIAIKAILGVSMWKWVLVTELERNTDNTIWNKRYNRGWCSFLKEKYEFSS